MSHYYFTSWALSKEIKDKVQKDKDRYVDVACKLPWSLGGHVDQL